MTVKSKTMKALAAVTAAGVLTVGGATAALAADSPSGPGPDGAAATQTRRHPGVRHALRGAIGAAAETLGMTRQELRAQVLDGPQSIAAVAGDQVEAVQSTMVGSLSASIDQAVANGRISTERSEQAKARLPQFVDRVVNRVPRQPAQQ